MSITREAAYLYIYSKELTQKNKKLHGLSKEAQHHAQRYQQAKDEGDKHKHSKKHHKVSQEMKELLKDQSLLLSRIKHHLVNFNGALRKELKQ